MKRAYYLILIVLAFAFPLSSIAQAACSGSSPTWTAAGLTPTDFNDCHTAASAGDTINFPAGSSAAWATTVTLTKGLHLVGAGIGVTIINGNNRGEGNYLISYAPSSNSQVFEVTGFTFNITNQNGLIMRTNSEPTTHTNVRIHHNRFTNSTITGAAIYNWGMFGVIDNNTFDAMRYPLRVGQSGTTLGQNAWNAYGDDFHGTSDNMYVEDNTFSDLSTTLSDCDHGGRYAFRYNSLNAVSEMFPYLDAHEWGATGYACMGVEIYGNTANIGQRILDSQGASRNIAHHNQVVDGVILVRSDGSGGCSPSLSARQFLNNTYIFRNRVSATGAIIQVTETTDVCGTINENSTYWDDAASFTGATGIGSGTLAARPATCTTGVGYWATTQSTTSLAGMVGVNPSTPISGTLYKCTSTNTWTSWYSPYTYPHPLRGGDVTPPAAPTGITVTQREVEVY